MPTAPFTAWLRDPARRVAPLPLAIALFVLLFVLLLLRNVGNYASLFADEWYYSSFARLVPAADSLLPSYLYLRLFGLTNACGDGFLECARLVNAVLFFCAAPFIYLTARRLMAARPAAVVALLAMLAPVNVYTAYFMPEATYYLAFWVFAWTCFRFADAPAAASALLAGAALGACALIKVHALFLLPPFGVFVAFVCFSARQRSSARHWVLATAFYFGLALACAAAVRFGGGYLLAGKAGLSLMGPWYGTQSGQRPPFLALLLPAMQNLRGHLIGLALVFALPLAALLAHLGDRRARRAAPAHTGSLLAFTVLMFGALLAMTVFFTASVAGGGPFETVGRLHMRYYDFLFPLFLMFAASQLAAPAVSEGRRARLVAALLLGAAVLYGRWRLNTDFTPIFIDTPEVWSLAASNGVFNLFVLLGLATLACWVRSVHLGARAFLYLFTPLLMAVSAASLGAIVRENNVAGPFIKAGLFARDHLSQAERDKLTIVGADEGNVFKTRFYVDNPNAGMLIAPEGKGFQAGELGKQKDFALVIGNHPAPPGAVPQNVMRQFVLYKMERVDRLLRAIDFSQPPAGVRVSGLSSAEPWGRWSEAKQVEFIFDTPLPRKLRLHLNGRAVGPNVGVPFTVRIGARQAQATWEAGSTAALVELDTDGSATRIVIEVPHPVAASEVGPNKADQRSIGLGFISMELAEPKADAPAPK